MKNGLKRGRRGCAEMKLFYEAFAVVQAGGRGYLHY